MFSRFFTSNKGLTLIEILVALALVGIASTAIYGFLNFTVNNYQDGEEKIRVQDYTRLVADEITEELRGVTSARLIEDVDSSEIDSENYNYMYVKPDIDLVIKRVKNELGLIVEEKIPGVSGVKYVDQAGNVIKDFTPDYELTFFIDDDNPGVLHFNLVEVNSGLKWNQLYI